jgi:hypothetical protein
MKLWLVARCGEESQSAPAKGDVTCLNPARWIGHFNYHNVEAYVKELS